MKTGKDTSVRSASDSLASSDSSSPFARGVASFEFPGNGSDMKRIQGKQNDDD